jgi:hypothetical protein
MAFRTAAEPAGQASAALPQGLEHKGKRRSFPADGAGNEAAHWDDQSAGQGCHSGPRKPGRKPRDPRPSRPQPSLAQACRAFRKTVPSVVFYLTCGALEFLSLTEPDQDPTCHGVIGEPILTRARADVCPIGAASEIGYLGTLPLRAFTLKMDGECPLATPREASAVQNLLCRSSLLEPCNGKAVSQV